MTRCPYFEKKIVYVVIKVDIINKGASIERVFKTKENAESFLKVRNSYEDYQFYYKIQDIVITE